MRTRAFRAIRAAAITLLALWVAYVVGINLVLGFDVLEDFIDDAQDEVTITFERAWSLWPGYVSVDTLRIVGHDDTVEFVVDVDHADVEVNLARIAATEFHVDTATVTGVAFRLRTTDTVDGLCRFPKRPPIPGLADPTRADCRDQPETVRAPSPDGPPDDTVRVHLERMVVRDIREIWIDQARLVGDATAGGAWYFWPGVLLAFDDARIEVHTATVTWPGVVARDFTMQGSVSTSSTISIDYDELDDVLAKLRVRARGEARVDGALAVDGWRVEARDARTRFEAAVRRGAAVDAWIDSDVRRGDFVVAKAPMTADVYAKAALAGRWPKVSLGGSQLMVRNSDLAGDDDPWTATVETADSTNAPEGSSLTGVLRFEARDARLMKTLVRRETKLPGWILEPLAETRPMGSVEIARRGGAWLVPRAEVRTGILTTLVRAAYGERFEAMALFQSGGVAAAYRVDGDKSDVVLVDAVDAFQSYRFD